MYCIQHLICISYSLERAHGDNVWESSSSSGFCFFFLHLDAFISTAEDGFAEGCEDTLFKSIISICSYDLKSYFVQVNAQTEEDICPLVSAVAANSLPCVELLVKVNKIIFSLFRYMYFKLLNPQLSILKKLCCRKHVVLLFDA